MNTLKLLVIGKDQESIDNFDLTHTLEYDPILIANTDNQSLARIGNKFLDEPWDSPAQVFGMVHTDTYFGPGALSIFTACALDRNVCGIVGRVPLTQELRTYVNAWCRVNPGPVMTLDACSVFFRRDLGLYFDSQTFDSYHCHVEDLCMQAQERKIPVVVPAADATHLAPGHDPNGPWVQEYQGYRYKLGQKWGMKGMVVFTT